MQLKTQNLGCPHCKYFINDFILLNKHISENHSLKEVETKMEKVTCSICGISVIPGTIVDIRCINSLTHDFSSQIPKKFPTREEIKECYDALNPDFLEALALLAGHAKEKYGSWEQYQDGRLKGNHSPITHIQAHHIQYRQAKPYDRFDKSKKWHLVAIAYNAMMEFFYETHPEVK